MKKLSLWIPPTMRFIVEATTWIWLLMFNWYLLPLSMLSLAMFNFPGDKRPVEVKSPGFAVPGIVRISVEFGSALLGIYAAYGLFGNIGIAFQIIISLLSFILDFPRWLWMLGKREVPEFVTMVHKSHY